MKRDLAAWVSPLVAAAVLTATVVQTLAALSATGAFGWHRARARTAVAPAFQAIDRALDRNDPHFTLAGLRDPFMYGSTAGDNPGATPPRVVARPRPVPVPAIPDPIVTAIVWDSDPRALLRWQNKEWTIREGGLFDEFQVVSISRDEVTLRRGESILVLHRRNPGE